MNNIDIITELLIDFDEMSFTPTTLVPNPEAYAIEWRAEITKAIREYKTDVAREIFEEIYDECFDQFGYMNYEALSDLKKKYIGE